MEARAADGRYRYRSAIPLAGGSVAAVLFFLLGIVMTVGGIHAGGGATPVGAVVVAGAVVLAALAITAFAELTPEGLGFRSNFRYKLVPWDRVESLRIAPAPGMGPWWSIEVEVRGGKPVLVGSVMGTRRQAERLIVAIEEFWGSLSPDPER